MPYNVHLHTSLEHALLSFVWRWKIATTSALAARFYPDRSLESAYRRLRLLEQGGYLKSIRFDGDTRFVWMLTKKGFHLVRNRLPQLVSQSIHSESVEHDLLVEAFHLGPLLTGESEQINLFTEQQLRCLAPGLWPEWVPRIEERRPDGYWRIKSGEISQVVGLEVELHEKSATEYKTIRRAYGFCNAASSVLWIVPRDSIARRIHDIVNQSSAVPPKHNFAILKDCLERGWNAVIVIGPEQGKSISQLLLHQSSTAHPPVEQQWILNTRKSPHKSVGCKFKNPPSDFN